MRKYDHVERLGHPNVEGILKGTVYIFPKLDGSNASVWWDDGFHAASRNRELSAESDNHGFFAWASSEPRILNIVQRYPRWIFYGEWLVPHSIKTYADDAWRRFYVFDVWDRSTERYVHPEVYLLALTQVESIPAKYVLCNPTRERIAELAEPVSEWLVQAGKGPGEGVVVKNYYWKNKFGRQPWAKHVISRGGSRKAAVQRDGIEAEIVSRYATEEWIRKEFLKVCMRLADGEVSEGFVQENRGKLIPMVLGCLFHVFVDEFTFAAVKKYRNPTIDFGVLNGALTGEIKAVLVELF